MLNLLRADFFKLKKDKTLRYALLLTLFFALLNVLLLVVMKNIDMPLPPEVSGLPFTFITTTKQAFLNAFSLSNNMGFVIPIIISAFIGKEFSYGTIRNKVISGKTKKQIYFSSFITSIFISMILFLVYLALTLVMGAILLDYGSTFDLNEVLFLIKNTLLGLVLMIVVSAIVTFITLLSKNMTLSIILVVVITLFGSSILVALGTINQTFSSILSFIYVGQSSILVSGIYNNEFIIKVFISSIGTVALFTIVGSYVFTKMDLK